MKIGRWIRLGTALAVAAGCGGLDPDAGSEEAEIRGLERRAVGRAQEYPAQAYSTAEEARFATSKKARRELGWHVLAKALKPVAIAGKTEEGKPAATIPLFRTWLGGDEISRMFVKMYNDLGPEGRRARKVPAPGTIEELFAWNATELGPNSEGEYFERLKKVATQADADGLGGNARVAYSPAYVKKYFEDYPSMEACAGKLDELELDTPPTSATNFTNCLSKEFEPEAAVIKASWRRNDEVIKDLPVIDTTAATLKKRIQDKFEEGGWPQRDLPRVKAGPDEAYTVRLEEGAANSLVGLHIMTKELRHWVWVTVWWSPTATKDDDFGQDRPKEITTLGGAWSNYKMCVVTEFDEGNPDPRGGFDGSLGDALEAVHDKASWCSNGYIEKGPHNAETNCIGCHQHAGDAKTLDFVLSDERRFPSTGRTMLRKSFPADYSWAFATPASSDQKDRLLDVVLKRISVHEAEDGPR